MNTKPEEGDLAAASEPRSCVFGDGWQTLDRFTKACARLHEACERVRKTLAEMDETHADATRYRWLVANKRVPWARIVGDNVVETGIDEAIDAAITQGRSNGSEQDESLSSRYWREEVARKMKPFYEAFRGDRDEREGRA